MSNSFKAEFRHRAAGFRTPSPPRDAYEPISPIDHRATTGEQGAWLGHKKRKLGYNGHEYEQPSSAYDGWARGRAGSEHRTFSPPQQSEHISDLNPTQHHLKTSQSPLEVFATVATSPSLSGGPFRKAGILPPSIEYAASAAQYPPYGAHDDFGTGESLVKRSHSEIFESRPYVQPLSRPVTSHSGDGQALQDTTMEDAELLLSFAQAVQPRRISDLALQRIAEPPAPHAVLDPAASHDNLQPMIIQEQQETVPAAISALFAPDSTQTPPPEPSDTIFREAQDPSLLSGSNTVHDTTPKHPERPIEQLTEMKQDTSEQKTRIYKGWPKGKPRGPRQVPYAKRGTKRSAKQTPVPEKDPVHGMSSSSGQRTYGRNGELAAPIFDAAHIQTYDDGMSSESVPQRRNSTSKLNYSLDVPLDFEIRRRGTSVPSDLSKILTGSGLQVIASNTTATRLLAANGLPYSKPTERQTNLCASCNSIRNSSNGYHDFWIACNACKAWFHHTCVGFRTEREVRDVDKFHCKDCEPTYGPTTLVRKSSRAHASVDYAGLHEGKIRTSTDVPDHHYIKAFIEGTIQFQPESFPRMRPELVTAEYFERCASFSEPIVIPSWMNPRPSNPTGRGDLAHHRSKQAPQQASTDDHTEWFSSGYEYDCVPDDGQDKLDMVIPHGLTVRRVAELYGPEEKVEVIDVKSQEGEDKRWSMRQWADYYEAKGEKPVRNVISLEVSQSKLGRLIRRPKIVRDLDLQDSVWPVEEQAKGIYPKVQFYCLMSVANCYTDFHIDFGGSSVYYHILSGKKTFFFIPPKKQHLKKYEEWCLSATQGSTFLGDETKECYRVDLSDGDTMLIPSGWIHAVWTPVDTLVIGGNFLTRMHYGMQIQINEIEKTTGVARKFRYPYFQKVLWYAVVRYLERDPLPTSIAQLLLGGQKFERKTPLYLDFDPDIPSDDANTELFNARFYSQGEVEGWTDLIRYIFRTVVVALGKVQGVNKTTQEAVIRSMPKGYGDHLELAQTFAMWVAWKRGNEELPYWAYPNAIITEEESTAMDKKVSAAAVRRLERQAAHEASILASGRRSSARQAPKDNGSNASPQRFVEPQDVRSGSRDLVTSKTRASNSTPRRLACEPCRQRRIRCKHKEAEDVIPDFLQRFGVRQVDSPSAFITKEEPQSPALAPSTSRRSTLLAVVINSPDGPNRLALTTDGAASPTPYEQTNDEAGVNSAQDQDLLSTMRRARTKACDECRKSKRRCVHDERGEIDPVKAQESPVPRGPHGLKRPRGDGELAKGAQKKAKGDSDLATETIEEARAESISCSNDQQADNHGVGEIDVIIQATEHASAVLYDPTHPPVDDSMIFLKLEQDSSPTPYRPDQPYDPALVPLLDIQEQEADEMYDLTMEVGYPTVEGVKPPMQGDVPMTEVEATPRDGEFQAMDVEMDTIALNAFTTTVEVTAMDVQLANMKVEVPAVHAMQDAAVMDAANSDRRAEVAPSNSDDFHAEELVSRGDLEEPALSGAGLGSSRKVSENRSRTPSLQVQTTSNESVEPSASPPSTPPMSPLTDLGPSSPPDPDTFRFKEEETSPIMIMSPPFTRQTPRQRKQVERFSESRFDPKPPPKRQPSTGRQLSVAASPSTAFAKPATGHKADPPRSASGEVKAASRAASRAPSSAPSQEGASTTMMKIVRELSEAEKREEEDIKFARELTGLEFGLRRRSK